MIKSKKTLISILALVILILITNKSNAAVQYTRDFQLDGAIEINLTGLQLEESKQYEFALVTKGGTPETWNLIADYTNTTAKLLLNPETANIVNVLRVTDNGQVFLREKDSTTYIVDRLDVNLKLPYLKAIKYKLSETGWYELGTIYNIIGGITKSYHKFEKVTDKNLIEEFLKDKKNTDRLETMLPIPPDTGYTEEGYFSGSKYNDGLYIVWTRQVGANCKTVQGAIIHDGLPNSTSLKDYGVDTDKPVTPNQNPETPTQNPTTPTQNPTAEPNQDTTTAKQDIPKAGLKYGLIISIFAMAILVVYLYKKNDRLKGIEKL